MIHLSAFPVAGWQTGWNLSQYGRHIQVIVCDTDTALGAASFCAHRASLLGLLATRSAQLTAELDEISCSALAIIRHARSVIAQGVPRDVCEHLFAVAVQPCIDGRVGRLAQICRLCCAFRRRIGCTWGPWQASA
ncbi:MAG TPA: hypothetical protein VFB99_01990, partial [Vicinamibacterales bacterium]|nr:hypothetical protein [Vicinamibacterales bacterium]